MKGLITIIIIIAIVVVGFLLLRDGTTEDVDVNEATENIIEEADGDATDIDVELGDAPAEIDTTAEIIVITYSDDGFTPKEINVVQGQTVRFVNESGGNMWVASNVHPTHTILSEFDQKSTGDSYEFQFNDTGSWGYHNHVSPGKVGTVVVE